MPITTANTQPNLINTGNADVLLTQTDFLRNNPQMLNEFFNTYVGYTPFAAKLRALGMAKSMAVQQPITEHYFQGREKHSFTIGAIITAAVNPGDPIVIGVHANDMRSIVGDDGVTRRFSRPRKGEKIIFADRKVYKITAKDKTTNPHRLTIKPVSTTTGTLAGVTVAAKAVILAPTGAEATGQPESLENTYGKYQNRFTIVKETSLTSGTAMTTTSPLKGINGQPGYWYLKDIEAADARHEKNKSKILLFDQLGNGNVQDYSPDFDDNFPDSGTEGFLQAATTMGQSFTYPDIDSYDMDEFDDVAAYYRSQMIASNDVMVWQGYTVGSKVENLLVDFLADKSFTNYVTNSFMKNTLSSFQDEGYSADDMFVSLGFRGLRKNNTNFLFGYLNELNDSEAGAALGYDYWQFFMPFGLTRDAKTKAALPYIGYEYRGQDNGGYSRENEIWKTGGAGQIQKTDQYDVMRSFLRSEILLHVANGDLIIVNKPATGLGS